MGFCTVDGDAAQLRLNPNRKLRSRAHHVIPHDLIPTDRNRSGKEELIKLQQVSMHIYKMIYI